MDSILEIIGKVMGQLHGVTGLIMTFFSALADLANAPVLAASGVDGLASSFEIVEGSVLGLVEKVQG